MGRHLPVKGALSEVIVTCYSWSKILPASIFSDYLQKRCLSFAPVAQQPQNIICTGYHLPAFDTFLPFCLTSKQHRLASLRPLPLYPSVVAPVTPLHSTIRRSYKSSASMTTSSPFLNLPAELRNSIYEHYAAHVTHIGVGRYGNASPLALMQTCRQVHEEVHLLAEQDITRTVTFEAVVLDCNFDHILRFLKRTKWLDASYIYNANITIRLTKLYFGEYQRNGLERWLSASSNAERGELDTPTVHLATVCGQRLQLHYVDATTPVDVRMVRRGGRELYQYLKNLLWDRVLSRGARDDGSAHHWPWAAYSLGEVLMETWRPLGLGLRWCMRPRVFVNVASWREVGKERRPHAKTTRMCHNVMQERYVQTMFPRPRADDTKLPRRKERLVDRRLDSAEKLMKTLSLHDQGKAHWADKVPS